MRFREVGRRLEHIETSFEEETKRREAEQYAKSPKYKADLLKFARLMGDISEEEYQAEMAKLVLLNQG